MENCEKKLKRFNSTFKWFNCIQSILNNCGLSYIWQSQDPVDVKWLGNVVKNRVCDQYLQTWSNNVYNSEKCINYRLFKTKFVLEDYLVKLPIKYRKAICKLRLSSHVLPVEQGRYKNISRSERYCTLCNQTK